MLNSAITSTVPTGSNGTATNVNADGTVKATSNSASVDQNQFLLLLVNEMQNQDPTTPVDETQTLSQLAQFSQLQETTTLNSTLTANQGFTNVAQSATLIGKTVSTATSTDTGISGVVSSVSLTNGVTYLDVGGQNVDASTVTSIQ
ncbi:MAG: flagellar hook capping FlgD N-terminal domain-containing protein [Janthinobacterium lividum]